MADTVDLSIPVGCFVKTHRRIRHHDSETTFMQLIGCIGARVRVQGLWIFDEGRGVKVCAPVDEPRVETGMGLFVMSLYRYGITLRVAPHLDAAKTDRVMKVYECKPVQGIVTTADGLETYALLPGGDWLPCKAANGTTVAVSVPREPIITPGFFELTCLSEVHTLQGPYPDSPAHMQAFPANSVLLCDMMLVYPADHGVPGAATEDFIYYKLQGYQGPNGAAAWIRRTESTIKSVSQCANNIPPSI